MRATAGTRTACDHLVAAMLDDGTTVRLPLDYDWHGAQARWDALDTARREGRLPGVQYLVVRHLDDPDPRWADARDAGRGELLAIDPAHPKGFAPKNFGSGAWPGRNAAAKTLGKHLGILAREGGWVYDTNGRTICQGWFTIGARWQNENKLFEHDGRWYIAEGAY